MVSGQFVKIDVLELLQLREAGFAVPPSRKELNSFSPWLCSVVRIPSCRISRITASLLLGVDVV